MKTILILLIAASVWGCDEYQTKYPCYLTHGGSCSENCDEFNKPQEYSDVVTIVEVDRIEQLEARIKALEEKVEELEKESVRVDDLGNIRIQ